MLRVSTLRERASRDLAALRPDLSHRDQIKHWASLQGLVAHWDTGEMMVTFHPTKPLARHEEGEPMDSPFNPHPNNLP
jgi:hypothetical protein